MEVLDKNIINLNLKSKTKDEAFHEMSDMLLEHNYISDKNLFIEALYEREKMGITGLGNHIAIPHGKSDAVKNLGIAIGRSNHDIEWETHDDKGVRVVLLFAVSNDDDYEKNHMIMLSTIAAKLAYDENIEKLLTLESKEEIIDLLQKEKEEV